MHLPERVAIALLTTVAVANSACVAPVVGTKLVHTAYVADNRNAALLSCLDQCTTALEPEGPVENMYPEIASYRNKSVVGCVRRCPGIQKKANTTCLDVADPEAVACWDYSRTETVRKANPWAIVAVALAGVAVAAFGIAALASMGD